MKTTYAAVLAFLAGVNAHMKMGSPPPFNSPNNSPLDGSGSDFPCKVAGGNVDVSGGQQTQLTVGQPATLSFIGSAVHGGGSCQVSLASGSKVDKNTKWMVIASYEGGCPADAAGNLPANPDGTGAATFQYTVPKHSDIPDGDYVLAWTWHNRIGNREMYMNCANVHISGGASKKRYAPSSYNPAPQKRDAPLPDMFKANIGNGCTTVEGTDVQYPDPGQTLLVGNDAKPGAPVGSCGSSGSSSPNQPAASSAATTGAAKTSAAVNTIIPTSVATAPASAIQQSVGGGFATVSAGGSSPTAATSAAAQPSQPAAAQSSAPAAPINTGTPSTPPAAAAPAGTCNTGDWNCAADGKSFTRCIAGGTWSVSIPMSQGLSCTPGISANFAYNLTGAGAKRDLRSHILRRRNGIHGAAFS